GQRLRVDPADRDAVGAEDAHLAGELRRLALERLEPCMATRGDELRLVEPAANVPRVVAVQVEQLDAVVALAAHAAERSLEVPLALAANRVERQRDARHAVMLRDPETRHTLYRSVGGSSARGARRPRRRLGLRRARARLLGRPLRRRGRARRPGVRPGAAPPAGAAHTRL